MLTDTDCRIEKADRTLIRSAISADRRPINFSIRATGGEHARAKQKHANQAIDNCLGHVNIFVIEWPAIDVMTAEQTIARVELHQRKCPKHLRWFAGVHIAPRIHPWDEQELPFSTRAWIDIPTDTPEEAQTIAQKLFELGYGKSPIHTNSSIGKYVFAYALNEESLN